MATVYVTETGVQVHKEGQRLLVKRGVEVLQDIPLIKVDRLVLMGRGVSVTTPAIYALAQQNIDVLYMNSRGAYVSRLQGREHKHSRLRHAQALAIVDQAFAQKVASAIVDGKINNQRVLVQRHAEGAPWARQALEMMDRMRRDVDAAKTLDELRGREGNAAREYFGLLRRLLKPPADGQTWGFERREYYPPPDPINALLSFGYTLLLNDIIAACQIAGLDPDLGCFHAIDYNKPCMALDLEEEFRPLLVDSIVLFAVNRPALSLSDFEVGPLRETEAEEPGQPAPRRPILLKDEARKQFIALYETRLNEQIFYPPASEQTTYRRVLELQAYQMARLILGEIETYQPLLVR